MLVVKLSGISSAGEDGHGHNEGKHLQHPCEGGGQASSGDGK